jgi:hypothetical protein
MLDSKNEKNVHIHRSQLNFEKKLMELNLEQTSGQKQTIDHYSLLVL